MEFQSIIIIVALGAVLDSLTTYILAKIAEGEEQNPILKRLMKKIGLKALILWIPLETILLVTFIFLSLKITRTLSLWALLMLIPWIASSLNLAQIISIKTKQRK